ncbi:MAG TPA: HAMP domain-containing sensor histidine kinase [Pirellulales bacterium]|jgi:signal transduction histidine kinase|nr:HAMP domain-containing sensor histidine kinase [Pirellulales bacterium]
MRWPLRYQILFPFAGVMLAVVVGVTLLDAYLAARRTQRQIEDQLHGIAQTLLDANFPLTDAVLKQTRGLSGAEFLLTDQKGTLEASSLAEPRLPSLPISTSGFSLGETIEFTSARYFHAAIAVRPRSAQGVPLILHILYPERFLREARWQAAYPPLVIGTVLLAVVIALSIAIAGRLSRPILELRRELSRLVQGDFQAVPLPERNDELRDLIGSVNVLGDQLDELRRVIKRSERLAVLGQLSGGLAHQLRNSVTGARLAVQLHQRHCHQIDPDSLAVALRQLAITESHLQRFLTVGQPRSPRRGRCDLRQTVADVAALVAPACHHRSVALQFDAALDGHVSLWADADQLRQLLLNLVLNGIEAASPGGWVRLELTHAPDATSVRILDSGPGPGRRLLDRLFEPFATGKPEGIGLGLSVAKTIAEAHGGTIRYIDDGPTCFEVVLPTHVPTVGGAAADGADDAACHVAAALKP